MVRAPERIRRVLDAVAVVIPAVAGLGHPRVDRGLPVVAVPDLRGRVREDRRAQALLVAREPVPVRVPVLEPVRAAVRALLVGQAVTVVVHAVARLLDPRVDRGLRVVAVPADQGRVGQRGPAQAAEVRRHPVGVAVVVPVVVRAPLGALGVRGPVAVVVHAVALLGSRFLGLADPLAALADLGTPAHNLAKRLLALTGGDPVVGLPVAVLVQTIADLFLGGLRVARRQATRRA